MKLYIDSSSRDKIILNLDGKHFEGQDLLPFIDQVLKKEKKDIRSLKEIEVNPGPGSFTGLRVGVSVANALGWALGIKVKGTRIKYT